MSATSRRRFWADLWELGFFNYREYLASEHWADVKTRYAASKLPQRCVCGATLVDLHHRTYKRLGDERLTDLVPLCRRHHAIVHGQEVPARRGLWGETRRILKGVGR